MEKETFEGKWQQMKGDIQKKWGKLTNDEIEQTKGDYNVFMGKLTEKYGDSKSNLKDEVNEFIRNYKETKPNTNNN
jgi:uncharacterized protein YjbJ (UPF0337 family)